MYASMLGSIAASAEMSRMAVSSAVVIKLATDKYDRCTLQSGKAQDEAFTADAQKKKKGKSNVKCENCHKKGHTKDQCWAKGGGNKGRGLKCKDTVGSKSVAMFCSFRLFAVWRFMAWKSHLAL
jgi:hypothetical protein